MATYRGISGFQIKSLASDPSNLVEGEIWYNSTSGTLKVAPLVAAWASGGALPVAKRQVGGFGIQTSAVCVCGQNPPTLDTAEEYNGATWTAITANPEGRIKPFATGIETAGLVGGGEGPGSGVTADEWNGSAWGTPTTIPMTMYDSTAFGPEGAAVVVRADSPTTGVLLYDGSAWTTGTSTPIQMKSASAAGLPTAAIVFGTSVPEGNTATVEYASGTWTAGGALNTGRDRGAAGLNGTLTSTVYFGGNDPPSTEFTATETYDVTSWTTSPASLATARRGLAGAGTGTAALAFGGYTGSDTAVTEEYSDVATVKTITTS